MKEMCLVLSIGFVIGGIFCFIEDLIKRDNPFGAKNLLFDVSFISLGFLSYIIYLL